MIDPTAPAAPAFSVMTAMLASLAHGLPNDGEDDDADPAAPVRFAARVIHCSNPFYDVHDGKDCLLFEIKLEPLQGGGSFETLPFSDPDHYELASRALHTGLHVEATGVFVIPPSRGHTRRAPQLQLHDLTEVTTQTARLGAPDLMIEKADRTIDEQLKSEGWLLPFLVKRGYKFFDAVETSRSERVRQVELAVILQALSSGQVRPTVNPRISSLACSRPGTSKRLMSDLALLFSPVGQSMQPSMLTAAGLGACVYQRAGGFVAKPGALPNCHGGVAVIDDLHRIPSSMRNSIQSNLSAVAEDGRTITTKAATVAYIAQTALHINTNMQSVVHAELRPPGISAKLKDLGLPFDLLSRMDLIIELTVGDNATKQAQDMVVQDLTPMTPERKQELHDEGLLIKTVVARLIDRFQVVSFKGMEEPLKALVGDISLVIGHYCAKMSEEQQQLFDGEGLMRRISNSVRKLVSASARLHGRNYIVQEDIDTAWDLLSYKLEIVRWICDDKARRVRTLRSRDQAVRQAQEASIGRWTEMLRRWGGQEVAVCDVAEDMGLAVRTVGREAEGRGYFPQYGYLRFPTFAEEAERVARQEPIAPPPEDYTEEHYLLSEDEEDQAGDGPAVVVDTGPVVKIEPVPAELSRVVQAMQAPEVGDLAVYLLPIAFNWEPGPMGTTLHVTSMGVRLSRGLPKTIENSKILQAFKERLNTLEDVPRGRLVLQMMVGAGHRVPEREFKEILEKRPDLPAALREPIEGMLARADWEWRQYLERRRLQEEEARRRREQEVIC